MTEPTFKTESKSALQQDKRMTRGRRSRASTSQAVWRTKQLKYSDAADERESEIHELFPLSALPCFGRPVCSSPTGHSPSPAPSSVLSFMFHRIYDLSPVKSRLAVPPLPSDRVRGDARSNVEVTKCASGIWERNWRKPQNVVDVCVT